MSKVIFEQILKNTSKSKRQVKLNRIRRIFLVNQYHQIWHGHFLIKIWSSFYQKSSLCISLDLSSLTIESLLPLMSNFIGWKFMWLEPTTFLPWIRLNRKIIKMTNFNCRKNKNNHNLSLSGLKNIMKTTYNKVKLVIWRQK